MVYKGKGRRLAGLNALMEVQQKAFNTAMVGRTVHVLIEREGRHAGQILGRSPYLQAVHAEGPKSLIGQIVPIRIEAAARMSLSGVLATVPA